MSDNVMQQFKQKEADIIALSVKLNRWSLVLVGVMIQEQEQKLVASDLPVDSESKSNFWSEIG